MGMAESGLEKDVPLDVQCMIPCISHTLTHSHIHIGTFTLRRTVPVMCVCLLIKNTDSAAKIDGEKRWLGI